MDPITESQPLSQDSFVNHECTLCMHASVHVYIYQIMHVEVRGQLGVVSFRLYMGFRDQIQVVGLTWQTAVSAAPSHCLLFVILVAVLCFI